MNASELVQHVWLTTAEAAAYTRRHPETVLKAAGAEELESTNPGKGRGRRYRPEWLDAWVGDGSARC
jgi:excisionase family DNA binding protein